MLVNNLFKYWTYRVFAPGAVLRSTYESFQELLEYDGRTHEEMAELEALYYLGIKEDFSSIRKRYESFSANVLGMVDSLEKMAPGAHVTLRSYYKKFDFYSKFLLAPPQLNSSPPFVCSLQEGAGRDDLVGGKASQLATLSSELNLPTPKGFVITANSFNYFMAYNDLRRPVDDILCSIKSVNPQSLVKASAKLVDLIMEGDIPAEISEAITASWKKFPAEFENDPLVAVRSSCLSEDGACSFAGQYLTLLNVAGDTIVDAWLKVISSKYSPEALAYRIHSGLGDEETAMAVLVLEMVDAKASGVLYTAEPSGKKQKDISVHVVRGQGDALVSGRVIPESYAMKDSEENEYKNTQILSHSELAHLQKQGKRIAEYFESPRDVEWSITREGRLIFLQSRPLGIQETMVVANTAKPLAHKGRLLFKAGVTAAMGQACGLAYVVDSEHPLENVPQGAILVLRETLPSAVRILKQVGGVVAELGSVAGHFSTVCREFGVPLLLAIGDSINKIKHDDEISLFADIQELWQGNCLSEEKPVPLHETQAALPYFRRLHGLLGFVTPLNLLDPEAKSFVPESCRSLHDIIRFSHEQAVRTMFSLGDRGSGRSKGKRRLRTDLPLDVFLLDVGGGLQEKKGGGKDIHVAEISSTPFLSLWLGLTHPSVEWGERSHFDWKSFDEIALAGGVASKDSSEFASFAVLGSNYVNLNMRFGYHFTLVDAMCDQDMAKNYCQLRFAGGGGDFSGRSLRIDYVTAILSESGFQVTPRGDLLDARLQQIPREVMEQKLQIVGRLLGVTKLMDMRLKDKDMVEEQVKLFWEAAH
ncbi:phosphoenolpyruvate synthase/pyruvate phosphate dikinase [Desulfocapsa sulfexigens DSM 10523]|uniref:Phosphoenolpyruvate synthase n=1 Tax=Desulfocapsa sulfexigens (strain DSM 10523 / SB164P1) TaxID=1167006 RepID=M1P104_DESSD|nr:phosphoenolpyruvate synthase/pyruvate phosphate dikinase [Desulfocapsa sulfexigens DSM 10523]